MKTYTVKLGENIFDVALNIYGNIEGVFDLLVQNTDADTHTGLSFSDTLKPGMVLNYTEDFMVNRSVAEWLHNNGIVAKNGEHSYGHFEPISYITVFARRNNVEVCREAIKMYGSYESEQAKKYVRDNIVICDSEPNFDELFDGNYESVSGISVSNYYKTPTYIIKQVGIVSLIDAECEVVVIDWGDNMWPSIYFGSTDGVVEHCYNDDGVHIIRVYAPKAKMLNLDNAGGQVYHISY